MCKCQFTCAERTLRHSALTLCKVQGGSGLHAVSAPQSQWQGTAAPRSIKFKDEWIGWSHMSRSGREEIVTNKQTKKPPTHPKKKKKKEKAANNFLLICLHAPLGPQGGSEATVQPAELWHWLTSICPTVPCAACALGEERALLGKMGHQASTRASASDLSDTLDPALYFSMPLNFTIKIKAMIFPTLHR